MNKTNKKLVILTGAGVSQESGIQTFRDSDGMWGKFNFMEVASVVGWHNDKQQVLDFYNMRRFDLDKVEPNDAHRGLAELEELFDVHIITQNVDDLHERGGSTKICHLHGELMKACSSHNKNLTVPYSEPIKLGDKHEDGSQLRPFIVWFGEDVPMMEQAIKIAKQADIFVVIGTSLEVYPAASLINNPKLGTKKYIIDPKDVDTGWSDFIHIKEKAGEGVKQLITKLKEEYVF